MFTPINEVSRRQQLVDLIADAHPGTVIGYDELGELFGIEDRNAIQRAVNGAKSSVEKNTKRALEAVPNKGYRVVDASEHYGLAIHHQRKGRKQLRRAMSKVNNVELGELTQDQRTVVIAARVALAAQADFERRADLKYANRQETERHMKEQSEKVDRSESEVKALMDRIERLEQKFSE